MNARKPLIATMLVSSFLGAGVSSQEASAALTVEPVQTFGGTYGEFSSRWWQWLLSIPAANNPNLGGDCTQGQNDDVWFLPGGFGGDPVTRTCTIPAGKPLFLPVINTITFKPGGKETLLDLRKQAADFIEGVTELTVNIDGTTLSKDELASFRVRSPSFTVIAPAKGVLPPGQLSVPGNTDPIVSDGYFLLLSSLSTGHHDIVVHARIPGDTPTAPDKFILNITYDLTIEP